MRNPYRHGGIEQDEKIPHAHVYTRTSKSRIEDAEGDSSSSESTTGCDVSGTTKRQIAQNRVGVNLGRKDFEHG
jgi:hypothetical protein